MLVLLVLGGVSFSACAQGTADRAAHKAQREHQQMRQQMRAERERRLSSAQSVPASAVIPTPPTPAPASTTGAVGVPPRQLTAQERMQLREQLRQASRQRLPVTEQIAP
jgi:hypothetical protein